MIIRNSKLAAPTDKYKFTLEKARDYIEKQEICKNIFVSNGTSAGHIINDMSISLCTEQDIKMGVSLYSGWGNKNLASSFQYNGSSINKAQRERYNERIIRKNKDYIPWKPSKAEWMEMHMGVITLYSTKDFDALVKKELAEYHPFAKNCPAFKDRFENPDEPLEEYQIYSSQNYPIELVTFVAPPVGARLDPTYQNKRLPYILERLQEKRSGNIILLENFRLLTTKSSPNITGAMNRVWEAYELMKHINEFI